MALKTKQAKKPPQPPKGSRKSKFQRMFTARAQWPFDANPLFSNGVYGVREVFCA